MRVFEVDEKGIQERRPVSEDGKTIKVRTFFGEKDVTMDEFVEQWLQTGGVNQLWKISTSAEDMKQIEQIKKWVSEMARKSFLE
jgi:hypothetical protein|tara:strand:- start:11 stop:262 length:252 start_codon:yes stop_codon:yes gene_type:complete